MTGTPIRNLTPASAAQNRAARPDVSAWVSANAGSGKTRVLTNRVARLLLAGADPGRILCITYTKAAAAEMQARLYETLGRWTMASDAKLAEDLDALLDADEPPPSAERRETARRLFARALETPGGLRIQTIHAFCESLLGRFPLEAGVSPQSSVIDDAEARELRALASDAAVQDAAADPELADALRRVFGRADEGDVAALLDATLRLRGAYARAGDPAAIARFLGAPANETRAAALARWASDVEPAKLHLLCEALETADKATDLAALDALSAASLAETPDERFEALSVWLLTQKGEPRQRLITAGPKKDAPWLEARLAALQDGVFDLARRLAALERIADSAALQRVAEAVLDRYDALKATRAALDYDDLIARAIGLLENVAAREWVRYKLDGGVEHILVDEAQDTSPDQWRVIEALAAEFFAGDGPERRAAAAGRPLDGAAPPARTLFAVGDEKQSIYSFQGAAPEQLSAIGARVAEASAAADRRFERGGLATSFRSAPAVLAFVDRVFEPESARAGLSFTGAAVRHFAHRRDAPGRIELWPPIEPAPKVEPPAWDRPVDAPAPDHPTLRLAATVAEAIAGWIGREPVPDRAGGWRRMRAGDVMVLVRKRGALSKTIIKHLKRLGAPVAGDDRLRLLDSLAVQDLIALGRFALLPEDDLTTATLLRSPFCEIDETDLFALAHGRPGRRPLFYALQARRGEAARFAHAYGFLAEALRRADFERPYDFFAGVLGRLGARAKLTARLGPEAEDPIDEFLALALRFETRESPTLAGFLAYLAARDEEIKRETSRGRDEVRVLTVHGAKGLEAPVVVLPDTTSSAKGGRRGPTLLDPSRLTPTPAAAAGGPAPLWLGAQSKGDPDAILALREAQEAREAEEHRRLLYVAMTRAESRLVIAGAADGHGAIADGSWYRLAEAACAGWGAAAPSPVRGLDGKPLQGWRLGGPEAAQAEVAAPDWTAWPNAPSLDDGPEPPAAAAAAAPPDWALRPAPLETKPSDIAPSQLSGPLDALADAEAPAPARRSGSSAKSAASALDPTRFGEIVHLLLERLPSVASAQRPALAAALAAAAAPDADPQARAAAAAEALAVLDGPDAAWLFGPSSRAEVPIAARLDDLGPGEIHGVIDRLVIEPDRVRVIDFKTGRRPDAPPEPYLRQLAVYARALAIAFPNRRIEAALYWTRSLALTPLDHATLTAAYRRAAAELDRRRAAS